MRLEKLDYQLNAIDAVIKAIHEDYIQKTSNNYANPFYPRQNVIDVKMETGTGKTYVYTRLMHCLRQQYGFFKFIIIVPGIAIKEGVRMSIQSADWNKHFRQEFSNQSISLGIVNAGDFTSKKGRRKQIPEAIRSWCDGSSAEEKSINTLLLNEAMLASSSMTQNDYDSTLLGSISCPLDGLKASRPIVIIDEPHRFNRENKAWKNITEGLRPPLIIRFGATFPDKMVGIGKNKKRVKDYENLVYELNSVQAFNDGLVKGIHISYPAMPDKGIELVKYKVDKIDKQAHTVIFKKAGSSKTKEIKIGEDLSSIDPSFDGGVTLEKILSANEAELSNSLSLYPGLELLPKTFGVAYQELILNQALDAHFEKEKENFYRPNTGLNATPIKTNSLFFIDSIQSFRGKQGEKKGWLRLKFEELLKIKLRKKISEVKDEYKAFLEASLNNIDATIAGYFSEDNSKKGDEAIRAEVDDILRNKEAMLQFKNRDGSWNLRRFLFSKWTLREGWDNPNVFVIAKLRSSGSENSKLQEVGRGLRLPFDINGNRIRQQSGNEDFRLSYIIDYSEKEFAKTLVGEINADGGKLIEGKINDYILQLLVHSGYAATAAKVKAALLMNDIIDEHDIILDMDKLFSLLPDDSQSKLKVGKITGLGMSDRPKVRLNKENFAKLRSLWEQVTKRYILHFDKVDNGELRKVITDVFNNENIFTDAAMQIVGETLVTKDGRATLEANAYKTALSSIGVLPYGEFLKRLNKRTSLPLSLLHEAIRDARKEKKTPPGFFNTISLENTLTEFERCFIRLFAQKFSYSPLDYTARTSIFTGNYEFVSELEQGLLGNKKVDDIHIDKARFLYDRAVYDSEIEHEVLKINPPERVIVYGKLPRSSIKVPTYTGGTTSPDFVYAIRAKNSKEIELHLIVETKSDNPRLSDQIAVKAQETLFSQIGSNIKWRMETNIESFERTLKNLAGFNE
jgi:type III restriction enzyme